MEQNECRLPKVLFPYPGPCLDPGIRDVFVYLRPESNGVNVESTILKVIKGNPLYKEGNSMVYLANIPGGFIVKHRIVENHYAVKLHYAVTGAKAFTPFMKETFESFFQIPFDKARIVGGFEALEILGLEPEELFKLWVSPFDMTIINGQTIKKKDDLFIVNYNIPALLHKNSNLTDIAVMVFRSSLKWDDFENMIRDMGQALIEKGIMDPLKPPSRFFHYSKGPFSQILDGIGYFYKQGAEPIPLEDVSFARYLLEKGISKDQILHSVQHPLCLFDRGGADLQEGNILDTTVGDDYEAAYNELLRVKAQFLLM